MTPLGLRTCSAMLALLACTAACDAWKPRARLAGGPSEPTLFNAGASTGRGRKLQDECFATCTQCPNFPYGTTQLAADEPPYKCPGGADGTEALQGCLATCTPDDYPAVMEMLADNGCWSSPLQNGDLTLVDDYATLAPSYVWSWACPVFATTARPTDRCEASCETCPFEDDAACPDALAGSCVESCTPAEAKEVLTKYDCYLAPPDYTETSTCPLFNTPCHSCPSLPDTCEKFGEVTAPGGCMYSCTQDAAAWDQDVAPSIDASLKTCPEYTAAMPCPCLGSTPSGVAPAGLAYTASYGSRCAAWDMFGTYPGYTCNSWCYVDPSQCAAEAATLGVMGTGQSSSWTYSKCEDDPALLAKCPSDPNPDSYTPNVDYYAPYYAAGENYDPCACNGDTQPDTEKFGTGYGSMCNPWDLGKCGEWWGLPGANWCCSSWCYTGVACPSSSGSMEEGVQLAYSYAICPDSGISSEFSGLMDTCPWPVDEGTSLTCTETDKLTDMMTNFAPSLAEQITAICPSPTSAPTTVADSTAPSAAVSTSAASGLVVTALAVGVLLLAA